MEQYIPKSALVAEIEKQRQLIFPQNTGEMKVADVPKPLEQGWLNAISWMKKTINTLEVKEVDLDGERIKYLTEHFNVYEDGILQSKRSNLPLDAYDVIKIAKHFFELGLKAQKGE